MTSTSLTPSDFSLAWAIHNPSLDRFPWQLALTDRRMVLLSPDLAHTVVLPNGGDVYEPGGRHEVAAGQVPAAVLSAGRAALHRADGDELATILLRRRQIAQLWGVGDVIAVRPDLTDEQAWELFRVIDRTPDEDAGITWRRLQDTAKGLFGPAPDGAA